MKLVISLISILFVVFVGAQNELTNASVDIEIKDKSYIEVKQTLVLNVADSIQQMSLRILKFQNESLTLNTVKSNGRLINFNEKDQEELKQIDIYSDGKRFKNIELNYTVQVENESFYLPLFFTELASASSDNDFFKATIKIPKDQNMILHFPNVNKVENEASNEKMIAIEVPALPSLFRMELPTGDISKASITAIVDWVVALVFVLIGIIIWKKRNQLRYG